MLYVMHLIRVSLLRTWIDKNNTNYISANIISIYPVIRTELTIFGIRDLRYLLKCCDG